MNQWHAVAFRKLNHQLSYVRGVFPASHPGSVRLPKSAKLGSRLFLVEEAQKFSVPLKWILLPKGEETLWGPLSPLNPQISPDCGPGLSWFLCRPGLRPARTPLATVRARAEAAYLFHGSCLLLSLQQQLCFRRHQESSPAPFRPLLVPSVVHGGRPRTQVSN